MVRGAIRNQSYIRELPSSIQVNKSFASVEVKLNFKNEKAETLTPHIKEDFPMI